MEQEKDATGKTKAYFLNGTLWDTGDVFWNLGSSKILGGVGNKDNILIKLDKKNFRKKEVLSLKPLSLYNTRRGHLQLKVANLETCQTRNSPRYISEDPVIYFPTLSVC